MEKNKFVGCQILRLRLGDSYDGNSTTSLMMLVVEYQREFVVIE
jgi:hypothetical protein